MEMYNIKNKTSNLLRQLEMREEDIQNFLVQIAHLKHQIAEKDDLIKLLFADKSKRKEKYLQKKENKYVAIPDIQKQYDLQEDNLKSLRNEIRVLKYKIIEKDEIISVFLKDRAKDLQEENYYLDAIEDYNDDRPTT